MTYASLIVAGLLTGAVYGLIALGLSVVFGVMRIINFAHGTFVMLSMFATAFAWNTWGISPYASAIPIALIFALAGVLFYIGAIRPFILKGAQPIVLALFTLGIAFIADQATKALAGARPRSVRISSSLSGFEVFGLQLSVPRLVAAVVAAALVFGFVGVLHHTQWGRKAMAVAQDRQAAQALGINPDVINASMLAVSIGMAALAGSLVVTYLPADVDKGFTFALLSFVIVVLGGLGSVIGAWVAGLVVGVVSSLVGFQFSPRWQPVAYLLLLVIVLLVRPEGFLGREGNFVRETE